VKTDGRSHGAAALVFFGFYALLKGYLIARSTFLPRALGVLGMLAGDPSIVAIGLLVAAAQILWLLVFGVNEQRWKEQASRAAASIWA
jgi:hypothetical protein